MVASTTLLDRESTPNGLDSRPRQSARISRPERSMGVRGEAEFPVLIYDGVVASHCHAVEVSSTGIVLERGYPGLPSEKRTSVRLELYLENAPRPIRVLARSVRWIGTREAYKFTTIDDVDRLTLSEYLDHRDRAHRYG